MKCPACSKEMSQEDFGLKVQVCENGCKGIWFDHSELEQLDQVGEGMGPALEAALRSPRINTDSRGPIKCPKCGIQMQRHKFQRDKEVNVDECYSCGGFFLDSGDLKEIRDHYMSNSEVKAYAEKIISAVPGFEAADKEMDKETRRLAVGNFVEKILGDLYWRKDF
jgi:Zn-finger nucleic acid-binding protein